MQNGRENKESHLNIKSCMQIQSRGLQEIKLDHKLTENIRIQYQQNQETNHGQIVQQINTKQI